MIAAAGAVKHEEVVEQVKKLFNKLSSDPTTTTQLVAKEPASFTGSEVQNTTLCYFIFPLIFFFCLLSKSHFVRFE